MYLVQFHSSYDSWRIMLFWAFKIVCLLVFVLIFCLLSVFVLFVCLFVCLFWFVFVNLPFYYALLIPTVLRTLLVIICHIPLLCLSSPFISVSFCPSTLIPSFPGVESCQWLKTWDSSGYPARRLAIQGEFWDWLARCQYTVTGWDGKFGLQLLSQCGSTETCLCRSVREIHWHVAGTLSNQPTNKPSFLASSLHAFMTHHIHWLSGTFTPRHPNRPAAECSNIE